MKKYIVSQDKYKHKQIITVTHSENISAQKCQIIANSNAGKSNCTINTSQYMAGV